MSDAFQIQLMKFAEGTLSSAEEADLLTQCEMEPQRYRDLTLAVAEERRFANAFSRGTTGVVTPASSSKMVPSQGYSAWSLAVATAIALVVGWALPQFQPGGQQIANHNTVDSQANTDSSREDLDFELLSLPQETKRLIVDSFTPTIDPTQQELFRKVGYRLNEESMISLVMDGQGNKVVWPERRLALTPVSN